MNFRILAAGVTAPICGIAALLAALVLFAPDMTPEQYWDALPLYVGFGSLGAYVVEIALGVPAYHWLMRTGRLGPWTVIGTAVIGGILAFFTPLAFAGSEGSSLGPIQLVASGAFGGAVAGAWFWLVAFAGGTPPNGKEATRGELPAR